MKFNNVVLADIDHIVPDEIITSEQIEHELGDIYKKLRLPHGRLELMSGVKERRYWPKGTAPSSLSTMAAEKLMSRNEVSSKLDMIIHASVCRDFLEPATASVVHSNLRLPASCSFFDLSNACVGVLNAMNFAAQLIEGGQARRVLVVSGENGGPLLFETLERIKNAPNLTRKSIKKYIANLTIGSAACAVLIGHKDDYPDAPQIECSEGLVDSSANELCRGSGDTQSLMMETDSEQLLIKGIQLAKDNFKIFLDSWEKNINDLNNVYCHQVGTAHEKALNDALEIGEIPSLTTFDTLGNTGSAALPTTLSIAHQENMIEKGNFIALLGIGSGLSSLMMGLRW